MDVSICCTFLDSIDKCDYTIVIYDMNNNLIYKNRTNDKINIKLCNYKLYKIIIKVNNSKNCNILKKKILIHPLCSCKLSFQLEKNIIKRPYINLFLTDKNYKGLKIEKGEIILWQKSI